MFDPNAYKQKIIDRVEQLLPGSGKLGEVYIKTYEKLLKQPFERIHHTFTSELEIQRLIELNMETLTQRQPYGEAIIGAGHHHIKLRKIPVPENNYLKLKT